MSERKYYHYCYVVHDLKNNKKYFGVRTSEVPPKEDKKYMGSGSKINEARKLGNKQDFVKEILKEFKTRDAAMEYEEWYMAEYDCVDNPEYYNLSWKSTGGRFDYHEDLKDGNTSSPQEKNGAQKDFTARASVSKKAAAADMKKYEAAKDTPADEAEYQETYAVNQDGTPDKRMNNKKMGGNRPGAGRPKGSRSIFSKKSVDKLQELGIDPIEELVSTYQQVCEDIEQTRSISARTSLYNTRQKIMSELIKYGYRPIPREEKKEVTNIDKGPMSIILSDNEDKDKSEEDTKH